MIRGLTGGLLLAAMCARPGAAEEWRGGASLALDLRGSQWSPPEGERTRAVTAGPRVRAVGGKSALGLAAGVDLQLGVTGDGDLAYQVAVLPVGAGIQIGRSARLGLLAGIGTSGITGGVLPVALALPAEAFAEVSLGDHVRAASWARVTGLLGEDARQDGAEDAPVGDELELGLTLRWDRRRADWRFAAGNGYHLGVALGQQAGADLVTVILGYSLDAAGG